MSDNLEVLRALLAAEERDTLAIANANAAALRWAIANLAALPSAAEEPQNEIAGHINGYLPRAQAVEFKADAPLPEWVTGSPGVRAFLSTRPASARPSAGVDYVLVPREPTQAMDDAGYATLRPNLRGLGFEVFRDYYRAMLAAAQPGASQ